MATIPNLPMNGQQLHDALTALNTEVGSKAGTAHSHAISDVTGLQGALDGKAPASTVWTTEALQDLIGAMFQAGTHTNATATYDDATGTISIGASGGGASLSQEQVEDMVGALVQVQGTGISVTYDDAGNVLRIGLSGESFTTAMKNKLDGIAAGATANATDVQLRDRATHTGTQPISSVDGLQAALDGKADAADAPDIKAFATYAEALTYSTANPAAIVFSEQEAP